MLTIQIFLSSTVPFTSSEVENKIRQLQSDAVCLEEENLALKKDLQKANVLQDIYECRIDSLSKVLLSKAKRRTTKAVSLKFTENVSLQTKKVNLNVSTELQEALKAWKGPEILITSGLRRWPSRSDHVKGRAVDVAWNVQVFEYLESPEGKQWLKTHNLNFIIENVPGYKHHPHYKYIKWATGPHIHINICNK